MTDIRHPLFARIYARQARAMERHGAADHRRRLLAGLTGRVLEVGAGSGANFRHYPDAVAEVLAVEPEPHLRRLAEAAAAQAGPPVTVVDGVADRLPADDGSFDAVVCSLVLCSVRDPAAALQEVHRVLRPGGRLHLWEHVRADAPRLARVQDVLDRTVWPALAGGCHTARDTEAAVLAAGFSAEQVQRFRFPDTRVPQPAAPQVLGVFLRG